MIIRKLEKEYALVRALHAIPEGGDVDLYINGTPFFNDLAYADFSPYVYIPEGEYTVTVYLKNTKQNPIAEKQVMFEDGQLVTLAIILDTENEAGDILAIDEETEITDPNTSKLRVAHLSPTAQEVNILANSEYVFKEVEYGDVTEYAELMEGVYRIDIESTANNKLLRSIRINVNPNRIYTFYAIGDVPNVQIIQSLDGVTFIEE